MYIDKSTELKIRNRVTGEIKSAYQGAHPWIVTDEQGKEIMSDWEVVDDDGLIKWLGVVWVIGLVCGIGWLFLSEASK